MTGPALIAALVGSVTWTSLAFLAGTGVRARPLVPAGAPSPRTRLAPRSRLAVAVVGAAMVALVAGPLLMAVIVGTALTVSRLRPVLLARRQAVEIDRALPTAMDLLVLSVRAGLTPQRAIGELAHSMPNPVGPAFAEVVRRTERGQSFADALAAIPDQLGARAGALADVLATSERHGLPLGPMLDQLATEAAAARHRLDQADARRLPVRLSFPLVVCTLPSFVLLAIVPAVIAALSSLGGSAP